MTSRKNVGDVRHLVVFRVMIEVCDTGLTDDQYGDLLEYLKHDEVLWSDENKNDFYNVATKLAKKWIEKFDDGDFNKEVKVMVFGDDQFKFNEEDINIVFPEDMSEFKFFVSDGKSTSKLLGKHHEMSSMSDDLSEYFDTNGGVLVLHVDESNVFGLKDGDVIKSVDDNDVSSPKDVVKYLIKAEDQEKIKLKVVRHKKNKTLKYNK